MNKILVLSLIFSFILPAVFADRVDIDSNIKFNANVVYGIINISNTTNISVITQCNATIFDEENDRIYNSNLTSNISENINFDFRKDVSDIDINEDIKNLTREVVNATTTIANHCSALDLVNRFTECSEERARMLIINVDFKNKSAEFENKSDYYYGLYNQLEKDKSGTSIKINELNSQVATANTELNTLKEKTKNTTLYYIIAFGAGIIATRLYTKKEEAKPPEQFQFKER